eukprot:1158851-Pelagomonas_calceolata.AAC.3
MHASGVVADISSPTWNNGGWSRQARRILGPWWGSHVRKALIRAKALGWAEAMGWAEAANEWAEAGTYAGPHTGHARRHGGWHRDC